MRRAQSGRYFDPRLSNAGRVPSSTLTTCLFSSGASMAPIVYIDPVAVRAVDEGVDDLLGVAHDGDVRAVGHHDDLAPLLDVLDDWNQQLVDRVVVEVLFRLVHDDRLAALVHQQIEDQQQRAALARRQMAQLLAVEA